MIHTLPRATQRHLSPDAAAWPPLLRASTVANNGAMADNPRLALAETISDALASRYTEEIHAIGAQGSLAHHDDVDGSDVALTVVTSRAGVGPAPTSRRIHGILVEVDVISADGLLGLARTLTASWPLLADRYLTALALFDPNHWHDRLRDAHLSYLAEARADDFARLARQAWCRAAGGRQRAIRLAERHDTDGAMLTLGESRLASALVEGLLSRTYFRSGADAVERTGLGDAGLTELARRLSEQAEHLARRGRAIDGTVEELMEA
jgi:hypothetical protein